MRHAIRVLQRASWRSGPKRRVHDRRPTVESLEERALLSTAHHPAVAEHALAAQAKKAVGYQVINLVSDLPGAQVTDSNLKNPWGMAFSATSPFWVSDQGTDVASVYAVDPTTGKVTVEPLVVKIPEGNPTGQVSNSTSDFKVSYPDGTSGPAAFIFDTLRGTIDAWTGPISHTTAVTVVPAGSTTVEYTGLALGSSNGEIFLYAANDHANPGINVFNSSFTPVTLKGNFVDPKLNKGFAKKLGFVAYNVEEIAGDLYVTYRGSNHKGGAVAEFNTDGTFVRQIASNDAKGPLQAPWGVAIAPANFGKFSNALLVGNFTNGRINAFNLKNGKFLGALTGTNKKPIVLSGLWALSFGNGAKAGSPSILYFTAGIDNQTNGLFGAIQPAS
jgi:uncharacterized protein (TIGR03118 family)